VITPLRRLARRVRLRLSGRDEGRAIVEFVFLGVLLLVPLVYLVLVIARVQAAAFAVSTAAREAGRAFTTARHDADAYPRAQAAAGISFEDYGLVPTAGSSSAVTARRACAPRAGSVPGRRSTSGSRWSRTSWPVPFPPPSR